MYLDFPVHNNTPMLCALNMFQVIALYNRFINSPEELAKRPLLQSTDMLRKLQSLHESRKELYETADIHLPLEASMSVEDSANALHDAVKKYL